jgi:hypothetical protein
MIFSYCWEYSKESVIKTIEKTVTKVESYIFLIVILTIIARREMIFLHHIILHQPYTKTHTV